MKSLGLGHRSVIVSGMRDSLVQAVQLPRVRLVLLLTSSTSWRESGRGCTAATAHYTAIARVSLRYQRNERGTRSYNSRPSSDILPVFCPTARIRIRLPIRNPPTPTRTAPALPLDALGPVAASFPLAVAAAPAVPGLTADVPGLAVRS
jgi:hypothetical protein